MKTLKLLSLLTFAICLSMYMSSCGDDDPTTTDPGTDPGTDPETAEPISSFQFEGSATDWKTVSFSNFSQNATEFAWDFGDGNTSTEKDPTHSYDAGGDYEVMLTASEGSKSKISSKTVPIVDPNAANQALTGEVSKTWKLFREGVSMSVGSDASNPGGFWPGLTNDGTRPCLYTQEFTFNSDGTYSFDDKGMFWAEFGVFNNVEGCDQQTTAEQCFEAVPSNMVNECGDDVSAWLSGTHNFVFDGSNLTLTGDGAWIGIPKLATAGEVLIPQSSVNPTRVTIESFTGYDVMKVEFDYGGVYWPITYVSYSDESLEPALVTDAAEFGEDLADISPAEISRNFASNDAADWVLMDTIPSGSVITYGVANPDGSGSLVGQFDRVASEFQELQFQTAPDKADINFENLSTITLDIYLPSSNDYSGDLTKDVVIGFGDVSKTEQWWTGLVQYGPIGSTLAEDEWHTVNFDISSPEFSSNAGETPYDRTDLDMIYIGFGGSGHPTPGTYYIRNFVIN